ncbi:MAG: SulP family inorganic anion transporter [Microbacterium sp.]|jgi:SulP family sulfate permease|nr:SulP family inorganic anion transporter [Microbacterium sp.]
MPKSETFVMVATVLLVLVTHNSAVGVASGALVASVLFLRRVRTSLSSRRTMI